MSIKRACEVVNLPRSMFYYEPKKDGGELINKLNELAELLLNRGIDEYYGRLRVQSYSWNRKRVLRVYREMKLQMRRKRKRRTFQNQKNAQPALKDQPDMVDGLYA